MDEKEKINDSYLTIEAKTDINRMLGNEGSGGGSSFNTQLETSEGLTLGKGTENEVSVTPTELAEMKESSPYKIDDVRVYSNALSTIAAGSSMKYTSSEFGKTRKPGKYSYFLSAWLQGGTGSTAYTTVSPIIDTALDGIVTTSDQEPNFTMGAAVANKGNSDITNARLIVKLIRLYQPLT